MKKEKGWINIHINNETKECFVSKHPYPTKEEAESAIFYGINIEKVDCIEIEYSVIK